MGHTNRETVTQTRIVYVTNPRLDTSTRLWPALASLLHAFCARGGQILRMGPQALGDSPLSRLDVSTQSLHILGAGFPPRTTTPPPAFNFRPVCIGWRGGYRRRILYRRDSRIAGRPGDPACPHDPKHDAAHEHHQPACSLFLAFHSPTHSLRYWVTTITCRDRPGRDARCRCSLCSTQRLPARTVDECRGTTPHPRLTRPLTPIMKLQSRWTSCEIPPAYLL